MTPTPLKSVDEEDEQTSNLPSIEATLVEALSGHLEGLSDETKKSILNDAALRLSADLARRREEVAKNDTFGGKLEKNWQTMLPFTLASSLSLCRTFQKVTALLALRVFDPKSNPSSFEWFSIGSKSAEDDQQS